tara:strand:+ start:1036 stop:1227 length:192 start_codon:yes stop_codon:yes gene_type:complete
MEKPLTKAEIVGELLADGQISAEEAIVLLQETPKTIIYNVEAPSQQETEVPVFGGMWSTTITD